MGNIRFVWDGVCLGYGNRLFCMLYKAGLRKEALMLQVKNVSITYKKDLRVLISKLSLVLNPGDKAALIHAVKIDL